MFFNARGGTYIFIKSDHKVFLFWWLNVWTSNILLSVNFWILTLLTSVFTYTRNWAEKPHESDWSIFRFKTISEIWLIPRFWGFFSVGTTGQVCFGVVAQIICFCANAWCFRLHLSFWMHAYFALGFSPVLLLFFLTVILQNECCYFFTCCILASYIVLAYLYFTIICLFDCLIFCFFALYV